MKTVFWLYIFINIVSQVGLIAQDTSHILIIEISNINTQQGQIIIDLYENAESYDSEIPRTSFKIPKKQVINCALNFQVKIPVGTYAIAIIDDENMDNKINRNFIGYPLEGFGFSMYNRFPLRKPEFNKICFELNDKIQHISIRLQY